MGVKVKKIEHCRDEFNAVVVRSQLYTPYNAGGRLNYTNRTLF